MKKPSKLPPGYTVERPSEGFNAGRYILYRKGERLANCGSMKEAEDSAKWYEQQRIKKLK